MLIHCCWRVAPVFTYVQYTDCISSRTLSVYVQNLALARYYNLQLSVRCPKLVLIATVEALVTLVVMRSCSSSIVTSCSSLARLVAVSVASTVAAILY
jgi:hypothetical protein